MCLQVNPGHSRSYSFGTQSRVLVDMILHDMWGDSSTYLCEI